MFKCGGFSSQDRICVKDLDDKFEQYRALDRSAPSARSWPRRSSAAILENHYFVPVFRHAFVNAIGPRVAAQKWQDVFPTITTGYAYPWEDIKLKECAAGSQRRPSAMAAVHHPADVLYSVVTLFILSLTIFMVVRLTGDPVALLAEPGARAEDLDALRAEWGLDRSWPVQYVSFVQNILSPASSASPSTTACRSASSTSSGCPTRCSWRLAATLISFLIGIPAGHHLGGEGQHRVGQRRQGRRPARPVDPRLLARAGADPGVLRLAATGCRPAGTGDWRHLVMPALALGWYFAASLLRLTRSSMLEVLRSEYIKLARLKGLPGYVVIAMHAFKNALIPVLTLAGVNLVVMVNAAVIIEVIFAWPGIGRLLYEGIFQRDFPLVQGVVMHGRHHDRGGQPARSTSSTPTSTRASGSTR